MKKGLILLPLAAIMLSGCLPMPGAGGSSAESSSSSPAASTSGQKTTTGTFTPAPTAAPAAFPTAHGAGIDLSAGEHTISFDFNTDYEAAYEAFGYVKIDTGLQGFLFKDMATMSYDCWANKGYNSGDPNYLMMRNTDSSSGTYSQNELAYLGNCVTLGAITKVEISTPSGSSGNQSYAVALTKDLVKEPGASGTVALTGAGSGSVTASASDGYGFFRVTTTQKKYNGQLATLSITYVIS